MNSYNAQCYRKAKERLRKSLVKLTAFAEALPEDPFPWWTYIETGKLEDVAASAAMSAEDRVLRYLTEENFKI